MSLLGDALVESGVVTGEKADQHRRDRDWDKLEAAHKRTWDSRKAARNSHRDQLALAGTIDEFRRAACDALVANEGQLGDIIQRVHLRFPKTKERQQLLYFLYGIRDRLPTTSEHSRERLIMRALRNDKPTFDLGPED